MSQASEYEFRRQHTARILLRLDRRKKSPDREEWLDDIAAWDKAEAARQAQKAAERAVARTGSA